MKSKSKMIVRIGSAMAVLYLIVEVFFHSIALKKINDATLQYSITPTNVSALPQPFSIFRWNGLVQTSDGVKQTFFSVFDESLAFDDFEKSSDVFVEKAMQRVEAEKYFSFARHPWVISKIENGKHVVELRDLQFTFDRKTLTRFGMDETPQPFLLRYEFSSAGEIERVVFDGKIIPD